MTIYDYSSSNRALMEVVNLRGASSPWRPWQLFLVELQELTLKYCFYLELYSIITALKIVVYFD